MQKKPKEEAALGHLPFLIKNKIAKETVDIITNGYYINSKKEKIFLKELIQASINSSTLYDPEHVHKMPEQPQSSSSVVEVTDEYTLEASRRLVSEGVENPCALNFASARNPGGGFCGMNEAQEENLCRSSALYWTQIRHLEMYKYNRKIKSTLYSDYMIFSPNVPVFRNTKYELLDAPYCVSFISSPAANCSKSNDTWDVKNTMLNRIKKILEVAVEKKCKGIVLGAFGCGVFRNKIEDVVENFRILLFDYKYLNYFDKIVFAVPGDKNKYFKILEKNKD